MKNLKSKSEMNLGSYTDRSKKTEKADLENKKTIFFQIGLIVSLSIALFAFEWKTYDKFELTFDSSAKNTLIDELPPITNVTKPEPKIEKISLTIIKAVSNTTEVENIDPISTEFFPDEKIDYTPIEIPKDVEVDDPNVFVLVEHQPEFIGGEKALFEYLGSTIKYPTPAREVGIQGVVYINFIVEKDGSVSNVTVARGIGGGCDEEAVRVIKSMPKWKAGLQRDKPVRVQFNVPIKFTLSN